VLSRVGIVLLNAIFGALVVFLSLGVLDEFISIYTGKGVDAFTLGRVSHYLGVVEDIKQNPFGLVFGNGAGEGYAKAVYFYSGDLDFANLHSDTLKILYEYGVIVFLLFFYLLSGFRTPEARLMVVYMSFLFVTDNVLIYVAVMLLLLLMAVDLDRERGGDVA